MGPKKATEPTIEQLMAAEDLLEEEDQDLRQNYSLLQPNWFEIEIGDPMSESVENRPLLFQLEGDTLSYSKAVASDSEEQPQKANNILQPQIYVQPDSREIMDNIDRMAHQLNSSKPEREGNPNINLGTAIYKCFEMPQYRHHLGTLQKVFGVKRVYKNKTRFQNLCRSELRDVLKEIIDKHLTRMLIIGEAEQKHKLMLYLGTLRQACVTGELPFMKTKLPT